MQRKKSKKTRLANADEMAVYDMGERASAAFNAGHMVLLLEHCYGSTFRHNRTLIGMWALLPLCPTCDSVKTNGSHRAYLECFN